MKNSFHQVLAILGTSLFFLLNALGTAIAQVPQRIPYQAIARNVSGVAIANTVVKVRFSIRDSVATGPVRYQETHTPTTSPLGLFSVNVGAGVVVSGSFSGINWGKNAKFMQVELDPAGGNTFTNLGTTQMMSVPYALNAANGVSKGTTSGEILYWNGSEWISLPPGSNRQNLTLCNGVPTWGGCLPVVQTSATGTITPTTAISGGNISDDGGAAITERGLCWATTNNPTIAGNKLVLGNGSGSFTGTMTGMAPATTYFVKAYATNANGTSYGSAVSFITLSQRVPIVISTSISNLSQTTAVSGGTITSDGGQAVVARGVCWSISQNPTTSNSKTSDGTGTGTYSSSLSGLSPNTTYYLRAYATNGLGTGYGSQLVFTTGIPTLATLTTAEVVNVSNNSATCGGNISNEGGSVTARGVCWSTSPNPNIANSKTSNGTGGGLFSSFLTGLSAGTTYYVRAYATNASGTAYGDQKSFITSSQSTSLALVNTLSVNITSPSTATINCSISSQGGSGITERGACWSTSPSPTVINRKTNGNGIGDFTISLDFLNGGGVQYYVRAYAVNSQGIAYGEELNFITPFGKPTVFTRSPAIGINTIALAGGNVTDGGGYEVITKGICWATSPIPTIADNKTEDGFGIGDFSSTATNLLQNTIYYLRAYATNQDGTGYGEIIEVNTANFSPPAVDIDGNVYGTVVIGTQTWLAENLKTTRYRDGSNIPYVVGNSEWGNLTTGAWSYLAHFESYNSVFGKLYNGYAVVDSRNLCPIGWHVPTNTEWSILENFLGGTAVAGGKMKSVSGLWSSPNIGASNQSGFSGLPSASRFYDGFFGSSTGNWWTSTQISANENNMRSLAPESQEIFNYTYQYGFKYNLKKNGYSVRCLKD
jgi:uncharacterized protein (TIGR02145 family)